MTSASCSACSRPAASVMIRAARLDAASILGSRALVVGHSHGGKLERVKGIEPSYSAWKAAALPLSYTRVASDMPSRAALGNG
jgi:hypothetical protein